MSGKIDQAFIQTFIGGSFGLPIAHENMNYTPTAGAEYAELLNIPNDITPLSLNDSDETDGIFRIILRYPEGKGSINAKVKADAVLATFKIGTVVSYDGQTARVTGNSRQRGIAEDGWYKVIITIKYWANIAR